MPALYRWTVQLPVHTLGQFSLQAKLTYAPAEAYSESFTLLSAPVTVKVLNRLPQAVQNAITLYPLVTDLPGAEGNTPLTVDLNTLFTDRDGDPLTYAIVSPQGEDAPFGVQGNLLTYTPIAGSGDVSVTVQATDEALPAVSSAPAASTTPDAPPEASASAETAAPIPPAEVTLSIHQVSAGETLRGLRFMPDFGAHGECGTAGGERLRGDHGNGYHARLPACGGRAASRSPPDRRADEDLFRRCCGLAGFDLY